MNQTLDEYSSCEFYACPTVKPVSSHSFPESPSSCSQDVMLGNVPNSILDALSSVCTPEPGVPRVLLILRSPAPGSQCAWGKLVV